MGEYVYQKQLHNVAVCLCHNVPAVLEEDDDKHHFWLCQIDDEMCEIRFDEVFS